MSSFQRELLLIPCCATKRPGGHAAATTAEPLSSLVPHSVYSDILDARRDVLSRVIQNPKYMSSQYEKNRHVKLGQDFGRHCTSARYLSAVDRYEGTLYTGLPATSVRYRDASRDDPDRHVLILSALYGPLHPLSDIQDYNLKMSDPPAYGTWRTAFPMFLRSYVASNDIRSIYLYLGTSTPYLKVALGVSTGPGRSPAPPPLREGLQDLTDHTLLIRWTHASGSASA